MVTVVDGSVPEKMKYTFPHKFQTMLGKSNWDISAGAFLTCRTQQEVAWVRQTIITDLLIWAECERGIAHDVHLLCVNSPHNYLSYSHKGASTRKLVKDS